jgi:uncharacterized protein YcgI (DUF1989 family)
VTASVLVAPASAAAFEAPAGSLIRVTDEQGCQVGDLFAVARDDPRERLSQARTRVYLGRLGLRPGDGLRSTRDRVLLTLVEDTVGVHDLLFCGCSRYVFETFFAMPGKSGCLDHLAAALAPYGVEADAVEAPVDLFMATEVSADGDLVIHRSPSRPGDHVVLRAETDLVVGLAACADDVTDCNGGRCGPLRVDVVGPAGKGDTWPSSPP